MLGYVRGTLLPLVALLGLVGCGGGGPPTATATGEVTVDNSPLAEGMITFTVEGHPRKSLKIENGKYTVKDLPPGTARVEISWMKVVGQKRMLPESPLVDEYKEMLPDRYHAKSELKADLKAGENTFNWPLQGK